MAVVIVIAVVAAIGSGASSRSGSAAGVTVPDGPGVAYISKAGHFGARFPETPDERAVPESIDGVTLQVVVAEDEQSGSVVEGVDLSESIPSSQVDVLLRVIISAVGATAGTPRATPRPPSRAIRPEWVSIIADDGEHVSALAFAYTGRRIYVIAADDAESFTDLQKSFVAFD